MKTKSIIAGLAGISFLALSAQAQSLLAGWDFANAGSGDTSVSANFSDLGTDGAGAAPFGTLDLTNLVDDSIFEPWGDIDSSRNLTANRTIDFDDNRTTGVDDTFGTSRLIRFTEFSNGEFFEFEMDFGSVYTDFVFSYAAGASATGSSGDIQWSYSTGSGFTNVGSVDTVTTLVSAGGAENQISLSSAVQSSVLTIRGSLSSIGNGEEIVLDNFQMGGAVPEPSAYAAIFGAVALAFAAYRRRK